MNLSQEGQGVAEKCAPNSGLPEQTAAQSQGCSGQWRNSQHLQGSEAGKVRPEQGEGVGQPLGEVARLWTASAGLS